MTELLFNDIYKRSFSLFCKDIIKQPIGKIHREIIDMLESDKKSNFSIMISRGFYKTYVFSRAYPLWLIYKSEKPMHIIIQSMNQDMSRRILGLIRDVLKTNKHFEHYRFKKETDKLLELYLPGAGARDEENTHKIYSVPLGTRGLHGDLVICDDVMKNEDSQSVTNMNKVRTDFWNSTSPMAHARDGRLFFIGTPLAYDDLFKDLKDLADEGKGWKAFRYPAMIEDDDGELISSFPEVYPTDKLFDIRDQKPSWTWQQEYMLNPVSGEDSVFPFALLNRAIDKEYKPLTEEEQRYRQYYIGCDVAMSSSSKADYSAFCVVSKVPNHPIKIEYIWHEKGVGEKEQIDEIKKIIKQYDIRHGIIEKKGITYSMAQKIMEDPELSHIMEEWNPTNESKQKVLGNVNLLLQHDMLCIPSEIKHSKKLTDEMQTFGIINQNGTQRYQALSGHDDLVIGVSLAISAGGGWAFDKKIRSTMTII